MAGDIFCKYTQNSPNSLGSPCHVSTRVDVLSESDEHVDPCCSNKLKYSPVQLYNFIQIPQQPKLRIEPAKFVVSSVLSHAVRQARHSQNAGARDVEQHESCNVETWRAKWNLGVFEHLWTKYREGVRRALTPQSRIWVRTLVEHKSEHGRHQSFAWHQMLSYATFYCRKRKTHYFCCFLTAFNAHTFRRGKAKSRAIEGNIEMMSRFFG